MGMFDDVNFKMPCPECGKEVTGWQTKDTDCTMAQVEPDATNNFYAPCEACGCWIEFYRNEVHDKPKREVPLTVEEIRALGFRMEVRDGGARSYAKRKAALKAEHSPAAAEGSAT
jgi:hypothetical protein